METSEGRWVIGPAILQWVSVHGDIPMWMVYNGTPFQIDDRGVPPFLETPDLGYILGLFMFGMFGYCLR